MYSAELAARLAGKSEKNENPYKGGLPTACFEKASTVDNR
jgi:hypothetical protein